MSHSLAVTETGEAYSWGQSFYGALGLSNQSQVNASLENQYTPMLISALKDHSVTNVEAGSRHSVFFTQ